MLHEVRNDDTLHVAASHLIYCSFEVYILHNILFIKHTKYQ